MRAGMLRTSVDIRARTATVDAIGQPLETWTSIAVVHADVRMQSGMEAIKAGAETSMAKANIRIRRRTDVDAGMRVYVGAEVYEVVAVLGDRRTFTDLSCELVS